MNEKIANTLFVGGADTVLPTVDAYIDNKNAKALIDEALANGTMDTEIGVSTSQTPDSTNSLLSGAKEGIGALSRGLVSVSQAGSVNAKSVMDNNFSTTASQLADTTRRATEAGSRLGTAFPITLSRACKNIVDRFFRKLLGNSGGYESIHNGRARRHRSDAVQCAIDAMNLLRTIPAIRDKINTTIIDIAAESRVLGGLLSTMVEYGYEADLNAVLDTTESAIVKELAIGYAANDIVGSGNLSAINWMADVIGVDKVMGYTTDLIYNTVRRYNNELGTMTLPEEFIGTLARFNPNWASYGGYYDSEAFLNASPSAMKVFQQYDPYRAMSMVASVNYLPYELNRAPNQIDIVRDMYPKAVGTANYIPNASMIA